MSHDIFIFGSVARGDVSRTSDVDVLVIPEDNAAESAYPAGWSVYGRETITTYFREGRLFAWHLYLEARCVHSAGPTAWLATLGEPAPYAMASHDVHILIALLSDALAELRAGTRSPIYELGICYTALRDIAMSASWAKLGVPSFSKYAPYELPEPLPLPREAYDMAMKARHSSTRGSRESLDVDRATDAMLSVPVVRWANALEETL